MFPYQKLALGALMLCATVDQRNADKLMNTSPWQQSSGCFANRFAACDTCLEMPSHRLSDKAGK